MTDHSLSILGGLSARTFLEQYWQKKPLLIRQALPNVSNPLNAEELAGLSLEEEIESRIVVQQPDGQWLLQQGPFTEKTYQQLPEQNWTLLVQAVDQFIPEVAQLLNYFDFLPRWRIDDIMISYAAPGGGVGPHYDHYDVFLLQTAGERRWRIGQYCDSHSPVLEHPDLRLLADFTTSQEWVLAPGDMLYIPPQWAHWGIAQTECMTYSIGLRAPSNAQILSHFTDFIGQFLREEQRYTDAELAPCTDPYQVDRGVIQRLRKILNQHLQDDDALLRWFGQWMTEPRYPERLIGSVRSGAILWKKLQQGKQLRLNLSARLAWSECTDAVIFFASGHSCTLSKKLAPLVQTLCGHTTQLSYSHLKEWSANPEATELLCALMTQGSLEFDE